MSPDTDEIRTTIEKHYHYPLLFSTITGSHSFGIASPLSDYDVHGAHLLPLEQQLGFDSGQDTTIEVKAQLPDSTEVDIATHDLKKLLMLMIKGNGNVLEDVYSPLIVHTSPLHEELKVLGRGCFSKQCASHYKGHAFNQQRRMQGNDVKKLIHLYRCLLMGIHLMRTGEMVMSLPDLAHDYGKPIILLLIDYKQSGVEGISDEQMAGHMEIIGELTERLEKEQEQSQLPDKTPKGIRQALEDLLIRARLEGTCTTR